MMKKHSNIIGIDEVGRGPLAGPVTAAAIMPPRNFQSLISNFQKKYKIKLKDSKKLSSKQREKWFKWVRIRKIPYAISSVSPKIIDKINISQAANLAATKALKKLTRFARLDSARLAKAPASPAKRGESARRATNNLSASPKIPLRSRDSEASQRGEQATTRNYRILLDGGLKIFPYFSKNLVANGYSLKTIVRGDEKVPAISLASIVAKVHRDKYMKKMHKKYPKYFFDKHKGYGTKLHYKMIKKYGVSSIHRKSFLKK